MTCGMLSAELFHRPLSRIRVIATLGFVCTFVLKVIRFVRVKDASRIHFLQLSSFFQLSSYVYDDGRKNKY